MTTRGREPSSPSPSCAVKPSSLDAKSQAAAKYFQDNVVPALTEKDYATAITKLEEMKKEFPDDVAIIDGHIERLKKMAPAEEE